jgi:hypothetical protein
MRKLVLLLTVTLTAASAYANLGDTLADSGQRYGQPTRVNGNYASYRKGNWMISEWFNSAGYVVDICYYKRNGTVSKAESDGLSNANLPSIAGWYPVTPHGDSNTVVARIWLSNDNQYRYESGLLRLFHDKRWFSYVELSTAQGHADMVQDNQSRQDDDNPRQANNDNNNDVLPL